MKASLTVLLLLLTLSAASPCQMKPEQAATEAAKGWLALTDGGDYAASWETAAPVFKNGVTKVGWAQMFKSARAPLGKVIFRNVKSAVYTTSMPGAPDGRYVVIRYESSFEHKSSAIETVTPSLGDDGQWRVSGYYIR
jgi:hypothetical protein